MGLNRASIQPGIDPDGLSRRTALGRLAGGIAATAAATLGRDIARAQATPKPQGEEGQEPNRFVLVGEETEITYHATTDTGEPRLTYRGPFSPRGQADFAGDALGTEESALGRLVTVHLGAFPDQGTFWLTLLLPAFNPMTVEDAPAPFDTLAILKVLVSTIAGPPREGALEEYRVVTLEGTAEFVML